MVSKLNMIDLEDVYIPSDEVVARNIEGELIIVPIQKGVVDFEDALYSLNETGKRVWSMFLAGIRVREICGSLIEEYDAPFETIRNDVFDLIGTLYEMGIIKKVKQD